MNRTVPIAFSSLLALCAGPCAWAGMGQVEAFSASDTTVPAGGSLEFTAFFTVQTAFGLYGGSSGGAGARGRPTGLGRS